MGHLFPPVLESCLSWSPEQSQHRLTLISLKKTKDGVANGGLSGRRGKEPRAGCCPEGSRGLTQHLLGRPSFSICRVPSHAAGRALELDRPAPAPGLEASGSASQGLSCLVCEIEMMLPPGWAVAGGDETVYVSFVTGLSMSRCLIKFSSQRGKWGEEIHP